MVVVLLGVLDAIGVAHGASEQLGGVLLARGLVILGVAFAAR